jgi:hypothetical protein
MLLGATGGELDITASDLRAELAKTLGKVDRAYPGFGDFALSGNKAIEPGQPDYSLLYHALAAPTVVADRRGAALRGFPTLAEIDTLENYIYAARGFSLKALRDSYGSMSLAIVTFASHYRNAPMSVSGRHAQLCFARAATARIGNLEPRYDAKLRSFTGLDEQRPFGFRVVPRRFAAYLAVPRQGGAADFGPQDALPDDKDRQFWVPVHKLFSGSECLAGLNLTVELSCGLRNDELAAFHHYLESQGYRNNWSGEVLEEYPFVIKDDNIAALSTIDDYGAGVLVPRPHELIEEARFRGRRLTYPLDPAFTEQRANYQLSSPFVLPVPGDALPTQPRYLEDAAQESRRPAPEYINGRHRVSGDKVINLNDEPDLMGTLYQGGFEAQHYIDFSGDGWVIARCSELQAAGVGTRVPAFCMVGLPDFLPELNQRDLMLWWEHEVPKQFRNTLWATPPLALSQTRLAANLELRIGSEPELWFSADDDTVSAIVSQIPGSGLERTDAKTQTPNGPLNHRKVGLPDGSPGIFDPGWDSSMGTRFNGATNKLQRFLVGHGLGSPFIEDAKLCAALGSYWPGVAPDATRQYQPDKLLSGISYPWPTVVPFTDEEIGIVPAANGKSMPWDGVPGPRRRADNPTLVAYHDIMRVDYIDILGTMTAALTAKIDAAEYKARILAMAAVYWSLGIHEGDPTDQYNVNHVLRAKAAWAVLSFRPVGPDDAELAEAQQSTNSSLQGPPRYRFEIFRWGDSMPDPADQKIVLVKIREERIAFTDGREVLLKTGTTWSRDSSIPT